MVTTIATAAAATANGTNDDNISLRSAFEAPLRRPPCRKGGPEPYLTLWYEFKPTV
jgi:hypothetical protein